MNVLCGWEMLKTESSNRQNVVLFIAAGYRTETWIHKKEAACIAFSFVVPLCCLVTWCFFLPCLLRLLIFLKQVPSHRRLRRCCLINSMISGWIFSLSSLEKRQTKAVKSTDPPLYWQFTQRKNQKL